MSTSNNPKITRAQFEAELSSLKDVASTSIDPCLAAKAIAGIDSRVSKVFFDKVEAGYVYRGIHCLDRLGIPEQKIVLFDFGCIPGTFCLVPPAFAAIVSIADRHVVAVVDPYLPQPDSSAGECHCHGRTVSGARDCRDCDVSADVKVESGKARVKLADYNFEFNIPNWIPNGQTVTVKYHGCGCYCTKGGRADLYYNGQHITGYEIWGDCN